MEDARSVGSGWAAAAHVAPARAPVHYACDGADVMDMEAHRRGGSTTAQRSAAPGAREVQCPGLHGREPEMHMILDVMLEDSRYLDMWTRRQRGGASADRSAARAHVKLSEQADEVGAQECSRRMAELEDQFMLTMRPDAADEDMLGFDEFSGQGGDAGAITSTCSMLFRSAQSELERMDFARHCTRDGSDNCTSMWAQRAVCSPPAYDSQ